MFFVPLYLFWVDRFSNLFVESCEGVPVFSLNMIHCCAAKDKATTFNVFQDCEEFKKKSLCQQPVNSQRHIPLTMMDKLIVDGC